MLPLIYTLSQVFVREYFWLCVHVFYNVYIYDICCSYSQKIQYYICSFVTTGTKSFVTSARIDLSNFFFFYDLSNFLIRNFRETISSSFFLFFLSTTTWDIVFSYNAILMNKIDKSYHSWLMLNHTLMYSNYEAISLFFCIIF